MKGRRPENEQTVYFTAWNNTENSYRIEFSVYLLWHISTKHTSRMYKPESLIGIRVVGFDMRVAVVIIDDDNGIAFIIFERIRVCVGMIIDHFAVFN